MVVDCGFFGPYYFIYLSMTVNKATMTPLREIIEALLSYAGWPRREQWVAELVVRLVEERLHNYRLLLDRSMNEEVLALHDFDVTLEQFEEIKRRLEK